MSEATKSDVPECCETCRFCCEAREGISVSDIHRASAETMKTVGRG
jgi:hypothetical protein